MDVVLAEYDFVILNSSGGKDSLVMMFEIDRMRQEQGYPSERIFVSHSDLGHMEWAGTIDVARQQADYFGYEFLTGKRNRANGEQETLLDYVRRRKKWPDSKNRYCTSDFKKVVGGKVLTQIWRWLELSKGKVLYVFGFRAQESPARSKRKPLVLNKAFTTKKREVWDYLPIHEMTEETVWSIIHMNKLPYHKAYDLGMPRLSCVFCIFSPFDALCIAGIHNRKLLDEYIAVEEEIQHTFRHGFSLKQVAEAIDNGYVPQNVPDWKM